MDLSLTTFDSCQSFETGSGPCFFLCFFVDGLVRLCLVSHALDLTMQCSAVEVPARRRLPDPGF